MNDITDISIDEKIGSMLIIGFPGTNILSDENIEYSNSIKNGMIGSVILYNHNIKSSDQLMKLTSDIHNLNKECMIFVDQEGGKVQRLKLNEYPSAKYISKNLSESDSYNIYSKLSRELKEHGIDANFGPVIDLDNSGSSIIGGKERSYSENPSIVTKFAKTFIDSHRNNNIITCVKHFPGHGYAIGDTHHGLVDVTKSFKDEELEPFYNLIKENKIDMIMTAHIMNQNYDPFYPATLSKQTIDSLLRNKQYEGIIVSDDLHMGAIIQNYSFEESIVKSIEAGCDMIILSNNPLACKNIKNFNVNNFIAKNTIDLIKSHIDSGIININQIDKSYLKIKNVRQKII